MEFKKQYEDDETKRAIIAAASLVGSLSIGAVVTHKLVSRSLNPVHSSLFESNTFRMLSKVFGLNTSEAYKAYEKALSGSASKVYSNSFRNSFIIHPDASVIEQSERAAAERKIQDLKRLETRIRKMEGTLSEDMIDSSRISVLTNMRNTPEGASEPFFTRNINRAIKGLDDDTFESILRRHPAALDNYMKVLRRREVRSRDMYNAVKSSRKVSMGEAGAVVLDMGRDPRITKPEGAFSDEMYRRLKPKPGESPEPLSFEQLYPTANEVFQEAHKRPTDYNKVVRMVSTEVGSYEAFLYSRDIKKLIDEANMQMAEYKGLDADIKFHVRTDNKGHKILDVNVHTQRIDLNGRLIKGSHASHNIPIPLQTGPEYWTGTQLKVGYFYEPEGGKRLNVTQQAFGATRKALPKVIRDLAGRGDTSATKPVSNIFKVGGAATGTIIDYFDSSAFTKEIFQRVQSPKLSDQTNAFKGWTSLVNMSDIRAGKTETVHIDIETSTPGLLGRTGVQPRVNDPTRSKIYQISAVARNRDGSIKEVFNEFIGISDKDLNKAQLSEMLRGDQEAMNQVIKNVEHARRTGNTHITVKKKFVDFMKRNKGHLVAKQAEFEKTFLNHFAPELNLLHRPWEDPQEMYRIATGSVLADRLELRDIAKRIYAKEVGSGNIDTFIRNKILREPKMASHYGGFHSSATDAFIYWDVMNWSYDQAVSRLKLTDKEMMSRLTRAQREVGMKVIPFDYQVELFNEMMMKQGARTGIDEEYLPLYLHTVSSNMANKGFTSLVDVMKYSPFGFLMNAARPLRQFWASGNLYWKRSRQEHAAQIKQGSYHTRTVPFITTPQWERMFQAHPQKTLHAHPLMNVAFSTHPMFSDESGYIERKMADKLGWNVKKNESFEFTLANGNPRLHNSIRNFQSRVKEKMLGLMKTGKWSHGEAPPRHVIDEFMDNPFMNNAFKSEDGGSLGKLIDLRHAAIQRVLEEESRYPSKPGKGIRVGHGSVLFHQGDQNIAWKGFGGYITNFEARHLGEQTKFIVEIAQDPGFVPNVRAITPWSKATLSPLPSKVTNGIRKIVAGSPHINAYFPLKITAGPGAMFEGALTNAIAPVVRDAIQKGSPESMRRLDSLASLIHERLGWKMEEMSKTQQAIYGVENKYRLVMNEMVDADTLITSLGKKGSIDVIQEANKIAGNLWSKDEASAFYDWLKLKKNVAFEERRQTAIKLYKQNLRMEKWSSESIKTLDWMIETFMPAPGKARLGVMEMWGDKHMFFPFAARGVPVGFTHDDLDNLKMKAKSLKAHAIKDRGVAFRAEDYYLLEGDPLWSEDMKRYIRERFGMTVHANKKELRKFFDIIGLTRGAEGDLRRRKDVMIWGKDRLLNELDMLGEENRKWTNPEATTRGFMSRENARYYSKNIMLELPEALRNSKYASLLQFGAEDLFPGMKHLPSEQKAVLMGMLGEPFKGGKKLDFAKAGYMPMLAPGAFYEAMEIAGKGGVTNDIGLSVKNYMDKVRAAYNAGQDDMYDAVLGVRETYLNMYWNAFKAVSGKGGLLEETMTARWPGFSARLGSIDALMAFDKHPIHSLIKDISEAGLAHPRMGIISASAADQVGLKSLLGEAIGAHFSANKGQSALLDLINKHGSFKKALKKEGKSYLTLHGMVKAAPLAEAGIGSFVPITLHIGQDKYIHSGRKKDPVGILYLTQMGMDAMKADVDGDKDNFAIIGDRVTANNVLRGYFNEIGDMNTATGRAHKEMVAQWHNESLEDAVTKGATGFKWWTYDEKTGWRMEWVAVEKRQQALKYAAEEMRRRGEPAMSSIQEIKTRGAFGKMHELFDPDKGSYALQEWIQGGNPTKMHLTKSLVPLAGKKTLGIFYNSWRAIRNLESIAQTTGNTQMLKILDAMPVDRTAKAFGSMYQAYAAAKHQQKWEMFGQGVISLQNIERADMLEIAQSVFGKDENSKWLLNKLNKLKTASGIRGNIGNEIPAVQAAKRLFVSTTAESLPSDLFTVAMSPSGGNVMHQAYNEIFDSLAKESIYGADRFLVKTGITKTAMFKRPNSTLKSKIKGALGLTDDMFGRAMIGAGIVGAGYLALNFFRKDQMSNSLNPLDLGVDLGGQAGLGGEIYDYYASNHMEVPSKYWNKRAYVEPGNVSADDGELRNIISGILHGRTTFTGKTTWENPERMFYNSVGYQRNVHGNIGLRNYSNVLQKTGGIRI